MAHTPRLCAIRTCYNPARWLVEVIDHPNMPEGYSEWYCHEHASRAPIWEESPRVFKTIISGPHPEQPAIIKLTPGSDVGAHAMVITNPDTKRTAQVTPHRGRWLVTVSYYDPNYHQYRTASQVKFSTEAEAVAYARNETHM